MEAFLGAPVTSVPTQKLGVQRIIPDVTVKITLNAMGELCSFLGGKILSVLIHWPSGNQNGKPKIRVLTPSPVSVLSVTQSKVLSEVGRGRLPLREGRAPCVDVQDAFPVTVSPTSSLFFSGLLVQVEGSWRRPRASLSQMPHRVCGQPTWA